MKQTNRQDQLKVKDQAKQKGAALIAVLIVAVVMVILMGVVSKLMDSRLTLALDSKQLFQDKAAAYGKLNQLAFLVATQRTTVVGVSQGTNPKGQLRNEDNLFIQPIAGDEIRGDGYIYQQESGLEYAIQNESGLLPINSSGQYWLKRWFKAKGYNVAEQSKFSDILADYADADTWRRPGGAEKSAYISQGLPQPSNFLLQHCHELQRLLHWPALLQQYPELIDFCSLRRGPNININAMPVALWQTLWPQSAQKLQQRRDNNQWFIMQGDAHLIEPSFIAVPEDNYATLGGSRFKITVRKNAAIYTTHIARGIGKQAPSTQRSF